MTDKNSRQRLEQNKIIIIDEYIKLEYVKKNKKSNNKMIYVFFLLFIIKNSKQQCHEIFKWVKKIIPYLNKEKKIITNK